MLVTFYKCEISLHSISLHIFHNCVISCMRVWCMCVLVEKMLYRNWHRNYLVVVNNKFKLLDSITLSDVESTSENKGNGKNWRRRRRLQKIFDDEKYTGCFRCTSWCIWTIYVPFTKQTTYEKCSHGTGLSLDIHKHTHEHTYKHAHVHVQHTHILFCIPNHSCT